MIFFPFEKNFFVVINNGYVIYVDLRTGEKLSAIDNKNKVAEIYWSDRPFNRRGGEGVKGVDVGQRGFSPL